MFQHREVLAIGSDERCGGKERAVMDRSKERAGLFIKGNRPSPTPRLNQARFSQSYSQYIRLLDYSRVHTVRRYAGTWLLHG